MPTLVTNPGGKGGPNIQAPWGSMVSRGMGGGGMGMFGGAAFAPWRRRLGAGRIDPNMRDPNYQPPPMSEPFDPYADKPYGRGNPGTPDPATNDMINIYQGYPGFHPVNMLKDQVPSRFRTASGVGQSATSFPLLKRLSDAVMANQQTRGSFAPRNFGGGQGYGEGYPGDALKRLLQARLGGGL